MTRAAQSIFKLAVKSVFTASWAFDTVEIIRVRFTAGPYAESTVKHTAGLEWLAHLFVLDRLQKKMLVPEENSLLYW